MSPDAIRPAVGRPGEYVSIRHEGSQLNTFEVTTLEAATYDELRNRGTSQIARRFI